MNDLQRGVLGSAINILGPIHDLFWKENYPALRSTVSDPYRGQARPPKRIIRIPRTQFTLEKYPRSDGARIMHGTELNPVAVYRGAQKPPDIPDHPDFPEDQINYLKAFTSEVNAEYTTWRS
jgi:hypothetical protein